MRLVIVLLLSSICCHSYAYINFSKCGKFKAKGVVECKSSDKCIAIIYPRTRSEMRFKIGPASSSYYRARDFLFSAVVEVKSLSPLKVIFPDVYKREIKAYNSRNEFSLIKEQKCE